MSPCFKSEFAGRVDLLSRQAGPDPESGEGSLPDGLAATDDSEEPPVKKAKSAKIC